MPDEVAFTGHIRRWREDAAGGLAVVDIPADLVPALGGRRQMRVVGTIEGHAFTGSTMLVSGGGFCVGVSQAALRSAGKQVGDEVVLVIAPTSDRQGPPGSRRNGGPR